MNAQDAAPDREALLDEVVDAQSRLLKLTMATQADAFADSTLTIAQVRALLGVFHSDTCGTGELADSLGVKPSAMTAIVQRLVDKGLVERVDDPHDRRVRLLRATAEGAAFVDRIIGARRAARRTQLRHLDDSQLAALHDIVSTIIAGEAAGD